MTTFRQRTTLLLLATSIGLTPVYGLAGDCSLDAVLQKLYEEKKIENVLFATGPEWEKGLIEAGIPKSQIELLKGYINSKEVFETPVFKEAIAAAFRSKGFTTPRSTETAWQYIRQRSMNTADVEMLVNDIATRLRGAFPVPTLSNVAEVEGIRKKYNLTIDQYKLLVGLTSLANKNQGKELKVGILWALLNPGAELKKSIESEQSLLRRMGRFLKGGSAHEKTDVPLPDYATPASNQLVEQIAKIKSRAEALKTTFDNSKAYHSIADELERLAKGRAFSTSELFVMLNEIQFGLDRTRDWGTALSKWIRETSGSTYDNLDEPVDLITLIYTLKNTKKIDDPTRLDELEKLTFKKLKSSYDYSLNGTTYQSDVIMVVQREFSRIRNLPKN